MWLKIFIQGMKRTPSASMVLKTSSLTFQKSYAKGKLRPPHSSSEVGLVREVEKTLEKNRTVKEITSFLGSGIWPRFVPAAVDAVAGRTEFLTSYTPYKPEINKDLLKALVEYQIHIRELVDIDVDPMSLVKYGVTISPKEIPQPSVFSKLDVLSDNIKRLVLINLATA